MEALLNYINSNIFELKPEYIKIIVFLWSITKCTVLFLFCLSATGFVCDKIFKKIILHIDSAERQRQVMTLKTLMRHALHGIIFAIYIMNMLFLFGIDVRPLIATAGVMGVAIGFGAKRFVEDVITGLIILIEGQIRVGDFVEIQGMKGFVEKVTLNLVTVRSVETGAVNFIRCGYIDTVTNYTINYSYAFFPLDVAYKENIDHVIKTIRKSYDILLQNEEYKKLVLADIEIYGLDEFKESSLCVKCRIKTQPKGQWTIKRAFNKIIKEQFELENIEIPFNQIVVTSNQISAE
ncbi:MAG: mechanosensitive ion channel [Candidatus Gastranaerophilales bacterium]|nr:mechanosensitive ion channel [Candidatus Gastranaerophilales bacterium]